MFGFLMVCLCILIQVYTNLCNHLKRCKTWQNLALFREICGYLWTIMYKDNRKNVQKLDTKKFGIQMNPDLGCPVFRWWLYCKTTRLLFKKTKQFVRVFLTFFPAWRFYWQHCWPDTARPDSGDGRKNIFRNSRITQDQGSGNLAKSYSGI